MIAPIEALDARVLEYLFAARTAGGVELFTGITAWSEWTIILPAAAAIAAASYLAARRQEVIGMLVSVFGSALAVLILKYAIARPRPPVSFWAIQETGPSFPSAHAALAVAFWGFIAYVIYRNTKNHAVRIGAIAAATLISLLVGFSRLYLGVHYVSDVLAGFFVGAIFLFVGIIAARRPRA